MQRVANNGLFIFLFVVTISLLYFLSPVLTPFLLGALFAYLVNPVVMRLQKVGLPHIVSVVFVFVVLLGVILLATLSLFPLIERQIALLIDSLPQILNWLQQVALPWLHSMVDWDSLQSAATNTLPKAGWIVNTIVSSGNRIIGLAVTFALTLVVTFYFLRDYDKVLENIKLLFPISMRPTAIKLANECDEVLGAFIRGQLIIMLVLAIVYGVGLSLTGLRLGLALGLIGGLLSIVPYLGSIFIVVSASVAALVQYGDWHPVIWVLLVYAIGQILEGYVLTPYLIGGRIGLHPVAVIFSVMAGGALFGFFGVLLALPVAAVIMVLLRYARSKLYA